MEVLIGGTLLIGRRTVSRLFVTRVCDENEFSHVLPLFHFKEEGGGMCVLEEERTHRDPTEAELTRTAKRLAANLDNETTFTRRGAVAMELKGESGLWTK